MNKVTFKPVFNLKTYTYLALGDSYTIGESVPLYDNFPNQLAKIVRTDSSSTAIPTIIAKTGWTTNDLIQGIKNTSLASSYDYVTLLIGVNNQYRNYDIDTYKTEFKALLQSAINFAGGKKERVFVLSIPDWSVTPFAQNSGKSALQIAQEIDTYNAINKQESELQKVNYLDITPISRDAKIISGLIAADGLHPSVHMYVRWVSLLAPMVKSKL
jgi:lysophospholipase L1-like esterase